MASFRAELQHSALSSYVRLLARTCHTIDDDRFRKPRTDRTACRLTPPITARDLRGVPDLYFASTPGSAAVEAGGRRLRSVCGQSDLRAAELQDHDEAELWLARSIQAGQVPSTEEDQTSKEDTEDELSK